MAAIATTSDGEYVYLALDDTATGFPVVFRCTRADLATFTSVYAPGAGTACNLIPDPNNNDRMLFYGNFGTNVGIIRHVVSTAAETDISPGSLGSNVVNALAVTDTDTFIANPNILIDGMDAQASYVQIRSGQAGIARGERAAPAPPVNPGIS